MIDKIWYIQIDGQKEGPYSLLQLQRHPLMSPDTLVWREGFENWVAARFVPELNVLFTEESENEQQMPKPWAGLLKKDNELVLDRDNSKIPIFLWLLIFLIIVLYVYYRLHRV